jgi:hypothetical protein
MDLLLLVVQLGLVLMLVVMPVLSGYDKFVSWSPARKAIALSIAVIIAAVVFTQYRHLRTLHTESLAEAVTQGGGQHVSWYARPVLISPLEYAITVVTMGMVAAQAVASLKRRQWLKAAPWIAASLLMPALALAIKLRVWR